MDDMGAAWHAARGANKAYRAQMLARAKTGGWTQHTPYHFSRIFDGGRMDWWPSGGKAQFQGRVVYGHRKVNALIARLLSAQSKEGE